MLNFVDFKTLKFYPRVFLSVVKICVKFVKGLRFCVKFRAVGKRDDDVLFKLRSRRQKPIAT